MESNLDKIALDLYGKIQTRFPNIKIADEHATVLSKKEDIPHARFFEFEYEENGESLGSIAITLDADDGVVVQVSGDLVNDNTSTTHHPAFKFIRSFRQFAKDRLLNFDVQNIGKSNLDKRDYHFQAKRKELPMPTPMMENKMYGNAKISYQDLGEARLVVKHSQPVNTELAAGRTMHIESIYIENVHGERFKYPFKHLNGARALAEHIKHGGIPYDAIGKHITSLSEELAHLRKFKGYVSRQEQLSEAMGDITSKVMERIESIKKEVHGLQRASYYEQFAESFAAKEEQIIPEAVMSDWIDRLTVRTFNEELKSVFPYLYNLVGESGVPVRELSVDDFLGEEEEEVVAQEEYSNLPEEFSAFEDYVEGIMSEDETADRLLSSNPDTQKQALQDLNKLMKSEIKGGPEGINAIQSLKGIIDTPTFTDQLTDIDPELDIRPLVQAFVQDNMPDLADHLEIGGEQVGGQDMDTPPVPAPAPAAPAPAADPLAAPAPAGPPPEAMPPQAPAPGAELPPAAAPAAPPMAESRFKAKFIKAKSLGATLETVLDFGHKKMTIGEAIVEFGMSPEEVGYEPEQEQSQDSGVDEILKSIAGFWNSKERNFTIGGQRAKIKVVKDFKEGMFPNAQVEDVKHVLAMIDKMDPSSNEHNQIMRLAGVPGEDDNVEAMPDHRTAKLGDSIGQMDADHPDIHESAGLGQILKFAGLR